MSVSKRSVLMSPLPGDAVVEGPYTWPDLMLFYQSSAIWKIVRVKPWRGNPVKLCNFHAGIEDVELWGAVWVHGGPFTFDSRMRWESPFNVTPLNDMQVIALASTEGFNLDRVLARQ